MPARVTSSALRGDHPGSRRALCVIAVFLSSLELASLDAQSRLATVTRAKAGAQTLRRPAPRAGAASSSSRRQSLLLSGWAAAWMQTSAACGDDKVGISGSVEVLDLLNVYGRLAGRACFGSTAPEGLSCQLGMEDFDRLVFRTGEPVSEAAFLEALAAAPPRWPLRPAAARRQTALAAKLAEPRVLKEAAFARWFDRPAEAPRDRELPTAVAAALGSEALPEGAARLVYARLMRGGPPSRPAAAPTSSPEVGLSRDRVASLLRSQADAVLDWYSFLDLVGRPWVMWPPQAADR
mmetsp:Transcript_68855/g.217702  ORF Transcript_68855/g.217702 Transcript_68855/m.217702 type:complete len:294 (+) Transcript_68855:47-928(+)